MTHYENVTPMLSGVNTTLLSVQRWYGQREELHHLRHAHGPGTWTSWSDAAIAGGNAPGEGASLGLRVGVGGLRSRNRSRLAQRAGGLFPAPVNKPLLGFYQRPFQQQANHPNQKHPDIHVLNPEKGCRVHNDGPKPALGSHKLGSHDDSLKLPRFG